MKQEIEQQRKNSKLVENCVHACVSTYVEYILEKSLEDTDAPFSHDDIENSYAFDVDAFKEAAGDELANDPQVHKEHIAFKELEAVQDIDDADVFVKEQCLGTDPHDFEEPQEIFEWWVVDTWLMSRLKEKGEPVILGESIWGRTCTGQSMVLDGVISEIQKESSYGGE